ncbi:MAG: hypothetical protein FWG20_07070 [Candidatus Cloacimonetes bacterium]|nr:hypothetical protein [Candidatus Cloacimonadota bacterium]
MSRMNRARLCSNLDKTYEPSKHKNEKSVKSWYAENKNTLPNTVRLKYEILLSMEEERKEIKRNVKDRSESVIVWLLLIYYNPGSLGVEYWKKELAGLLPFVAVQKEDSKRPSKEDIQKWLLGDFEIQYDSRWTSIYNRVCREIGIEGVEIILDYATHFVVEGIKRLSVELNGNGGLSEAITVKCMDDLFARYFGSIGI